MSFAVTPDELLETFGPTGVVYFPRHDAPDTELDPRTADFLSRVGLPDNDYFKSKAGIGQEESIRLAEWFTPDGGRLPPRCRSWLVLAHFVASVIALDPVDGKVYAFGEGESPTSFSQLHRDIESLVHALLLFARFDEQERGESGDIESEVRQLRSRIEAFDPLPFLDGRSQWALICEEVVDGIW
jgi:hypothetical protein